MMMLVAPAGAAGAQATATASIERETPTKSRAPERAFPASVLWLVPLQPSGAQPARPVHGPYVLLQKNRMFTPHLLVVPVGTSVTFPNADPFFHNVFSLFDGKRFDLGLYEKGTVRQVLFDREGVSYIFCNIHPEMSSVVLALKTPWWARGEGTGVLTIQEVPPGEYEAHLWVEGVDPHSLQQWTHRVHLVEGAQDVGSFRMVQAAPVQEHTNKFGEPYPPEKNPY